MGYREVHFVFALTDKGSSNEEPFYFLQKLKIKKPPRNVSARRQYDLYINISSFFGRHACLDKSRSMDHIDPFWADDFSSLPAYPRTRKRIRALLPEPPNHDRRSGGICADAPANNGAISSGGLHRNLQEKIDWYVLFQAELAIFRLIPLSACILQYITR